VATPEKKKAATTNAKKAATTKAKKASSTSEVESSSEESPAEDVKEKKDTGKKKAEVAETRKRTKAVKEVVAAKKPKSMENN
jgi:hypothetical protein